MVGLCYFLGGVLYFVNGLSYVTDGMHIKGTRVCTKQKGPSLMISCHAVLHASMPWLCLFRQGVRHQTTSSCSVDTSYTTAVGRRYLSRLFRSLFGSSFAYPQIMFDWSFVRAQVWLTFSVPFPICCVCAVHGENVKDIWRRRPE